MKPVVSIVIPTYNRARDLERALKSVIAQTCSQWEALVVDNHSSDNTDAVIKGFNDPRIKLFKIHNNGVIAASRNMGIRHAEGDYIAFLDSDDWWMPEKLEESLQFLDQGADLVYHDLFLVTKVRQRFFWRKVRTRDLQVPVFYDLIINGNAVNNSSLVARKSLLRGIGGQSEDPALVAMEDFDACLRASLRTERFKRVPKTLGFYWAGGGNTTHPERTIRSLEAFEEGYANDIPKIGECPGFWWFHYSRGRAYYRMGSYAIAELSLRRIRWRKAPMIIGLKIAWMNLMMSLSRDERA